jgi:putative DNA primase/helicase
MDILEYVRLKTPPDAAAAFRDGKYVHGWLATYCPRCDPDARKRGRLTLRAGILTAGPRKGQPWWGCMRCHYEKDVAQDRRTASIEWEVNRTKLAADEQRIKAYALEIVEAAMFVRDRDPIDDYLRLTRLLEPLGTCWSTALRVAHRRHTKHPATKQAGLPVMLGVVSGGDGRPIAAHRTFLFELPTGRVVKVSDPNVPRKFRHPNAKYSLGPVSGGAVRMGIDSEEICVAEGIESALGLAMAVRLPCWSALSAGNLENLAVPANVRRIVIGVDIDKPDRNGRMAGMQSSLAFKERITEENIRKNRAIDIELKLPPANASDWAEAHTR